jgi:hypothetical protein
MSDRITNMHKRTREYSNKLLEMVEEGLLDKDLVIMAFVKYMSEDAVEDMMRCNEMIIDEDEEDTDEDQTEDEE